MTDLDRLIDGFVEMQGDPDAVEKAFLARHLLHCTLPHSDPGDVPLWKRKNGNLTLVVQPFRDRETGKALYPYGTLPRLLLYWIVTEAARTKSRRLYLGPNLTSFLHQLKLNASSGGKRGVPKRMRDQMTRLLRSIVSFEQKGAHSETWLDMQIGPASMLWWNHEPGQGDLFESWIELGDLFFRAIVDRPVPVDRRALVMLKNSSLALDLYGWVVAKTWQANQDPERIRPAVTWEHLHEQMGANYVEIRDFKKKVLKALAKVKLAYPKMRVVIQEDGLLVRSAPTPVAEIK